MSARAETGAAPIGISWPSPAKVLALFGGGALLVEAALAVLLLGLDVEASSPVRTAILRGVSGVVALVAAQLVLAAPRLASVVCLVAVAPAAFVQLPLFVSRLHALYWGSSFQPAQPTLGEALAPLLAWLLVATPLTCAAILAWRQARISPSA